ncbi:MAG: NUDIX domain-containing protein [Candidatus Nanopelagicales bacterium]
MTTPALTPIEQDLVELLGLVDTSRTFAAAAEQQFVADMRVLYGQRLTDAQSEEDGSPLVTTALLAGSVALIRRALSAGVDEGARFGRAQAEALDLPTALMDTVVFSSEELGTQLVTDFLAGQVAVAKGAKDKAKALAEMLRRAELAVVSAVQAGRGAATEQFLQALAELLSETAHKLWVARFDLVNPPCPMCTRLHGQHVPLGEPFEVPDSEPVPYTKVLSTPPRHPNCRCSLVIYFPASAPTVGLTAQGMQAYAKWAMTVSPEDRDDYIAATIVHVKAYTRMVNGHLQHVSGYYYDTKTGMKIPDVGGALPSPNVKQVSAKQAKAINKAQKAADKATPKGGSIDLNWKPGTYKVDMPGDEDTQVIVHQDGSSTSIHKGETVDSDKAKTAQFLSLHKQYGTVTKISDDPDVPDPDGPGPLMEMNEDLKKNGTLPEGSYVFTDNSNWGGVKVNPDGTGEIYKSDFKKSFPLQQVAVKQIANGSLGDVDEVEDDDFNEDWQRKFNASKAGGGSAPEAPSIPNQAEPGDRGKAVPKGIPAPEQQNVLGQQNASGSSGSQNTSEPGDRPQSKKNANGQKMPDFTAKPDVAIPGEPALPDTEGRMATGIALIEPDGYIWIYEPKDHYAGYEHTFPKGGIEANLSPQQNAHKELWEETGLEGDITGYLGDFKRSGGGKVRMYVGKRTGGQPLPDDASPYEPGGSETASVKKVSVEEAESLLNVNRDKRILKDIKEFGLDGRAPAVPADAEPVTDPETGDVVEDMSAPVRPKFSQPEAPEGGPGGVVKNGPSLFSVGAHSVQMEEGSQVYKSGKSKDTLYVLQPDGDLIKYNPQGAGVQAKKVGGADNPAARAQLLSGLNNVTDEGVSIQNTQPLPGSGKALVGGFEMTSTQLEQAINALSANPSGNVAADLKRVGSPLAAGKFHEVAAPYKAYYNNKTKPALIAALQKAHQQTGATPLDAAPAVAHLQESHGLEEHQSSLGLSDHEAIHAALHAVDPQGSGHTHAPASPGFISFGGVPVTPQAVAEALDALQKSPKSETGVKKPLKAIGSPLSGVDLQGHANTSPLTDSFKGGNGKVHYGKLKPAVIALLQDALDKHQTDHPPVPNPAADLPEVPHASPGIQGVLASQAQIKEMQDFFADIDFDQGETMSGKLAQVGHNPLAYGVDWSEFVGRTPAHEMNKVLFDGLNDYLNVKTRPGQNGPVETPGPDDSPKVQLGTVEASVNELQLLKSLWDGPPLGLDPDGQFYTLMGHLPAGHPFKGMGQNGFGASLGVDSHLDSAPWKQAVSDALQKHMDDAVLQLNNPPEAPTAPSTVSVAGKSVTKQEILDAIDAVKNSSSTSVKAPLKAIDSPLAKADLKTFIEADPLSAPFKGGNGKVHYGKLKEAVIAVLQGKADNMASNPTPVTGPDSDPDVTPVDVGAPDPVEDFFSGPPTTNVSGGSLSLQELVKNAKDTDGIFDNSFADAFQQAHKTGETHFWSSSGYIDTDDGYFEGGTYFEINPEENSVVEINDGDFKNLSSAQIADKIGDKFQTSGLGTDLAGSELPEVGFYTSPGGMALKVYPDGTAHSINTSSGQTVHMTDSDLVKSMLELGTWDKLSDLPTDPNAVYVNRVQVGHYASGTSTYSVYPDGSVLIATPSGESMAHIDVVKPYLTSEGIAPTALQVSPDSWMTEALKDPNGFLIGDYKHQYNGNVFKVGENGPEGISPSFFAMNLMDDTLSFQTHTAVFQGDLEDSGPPSLEDQAGAALQSPYLGDLVAKAGNASMQDAWAPTTTPFSQAFQTAAKNNQFVYLTGLGQGNLLSTGAAPQVAHYKFDPDGLVQKIDADGSVLKVYSPEELVSKLDSVYDGPSVAPAVDPVPNTPDAPDEVSPDGYWNGVQLGTWTDGEGMHVTLDASGPNMDIDEFMNAVESGDMFWVPPQNSPVASTPSHMFDADAPVLQPFMVAGHIRPDWVEKPVLLASAKKWAKDSGFENIAAKHLNSSTKKEDLVAWMYAWANGEWDKAYEIESKKVQQHGKRKVHPGSPENPVNASGFVKKKMPPLVSGEIPAGIKVDGSWPNTDSWHLWQSETVDAYLLAANMQHPTGLSSSQKRSWAIAHASGNKLGTDSLSYLGQKNVNEGDIHSSPILPSVEKYAPGYAVPLPEGFPEMDYSKVAVQGWNNSQLDTYLNHVGVSDKSVEFLTSQTPEVKAQLVALHAVAAAPEGSATFKSPAFAKQQMQDLLGKIYEDSHYNVPALLGFVHDALKLEKKTYTMNAEQPPLGGGSSSEIWQLTDEQGNPFLFKVAPEKFRAEIEHASHKLAELAGFRVAASELGTFNGKFGQFQAKVPSQGTLMNTDPVDLPISALKDLMAAHVQDWATANDDAHGNNFLLMPDGKRVMPIDIARSFVRFGKPGSMQLKVGQLSDWTTPYYDKVYKAALSGKYSDADVDSLYLASMAQARKTSSVSDASWGSTITEGLQNRTNFGWTSAKDLPDLVSQALARKNALSEDFEKFWDGIYSQLGREKPAKSQSLGKHVFSGFSEDHLTRVKEAGHAGASTFFGGNALEENYVLAQEVKTSQGGTELHMTALVRKQADKELRKWLVARAGNTVTVGDVSDSYQKTEFLSNAGATSYSQFSLAAAKTVSHHNGLGDQNFNSSHMANFNTMKADVEKKLAEVESGIYPSQFADWTEAKETYKNLLSYYDGKIKDVQRLIDFGGQSKHGDFDPFPFEPPKRPAITPEIAAPSDGFKVKKVVSYYEQGSIDDDGNMVLNGSKPSGWNSQILQSGTTYVVELPDGTEIEYRSWHDEDGVRRSQQGGLKIKVRNYDGTHTGTEAAMTALQQMGLDLSAAEDTDMELFYWRHLYGVLTDRRDQGQGKHKDVVDYVRDNLPGGTEGTPALQAKEELERWREAWSRLTSKEQVKEFVDKQKYMPKFSHPNVARPEVVGGNPYWDRFDADWEYLKNKPFATHSIGMGDMRTILRTGGLWSNEARPRMMGKVIEGQSSPPDITNGAGHFNFVRTNQTGNNFDYSQIYVNPRVLAKTTNYSFKGDGWGKIDNRKIKSDFSLEKATSIQDHNETMIKHGISVLDDIELAVFNSQSERQAFIDYLKSKGVTNIRGLTIEDRFVVAAGKAEALAKVKAAALAWNPDEEDD